jgi:hypothetical protein
MLIRHIKAPADRIFACFETERAMAKWIEDLVEFRYQSEPVGVGTKFRQRNRIAGKIVSYEGTVTAWERARHFGALVESDAFRYQMDFVLSPGAFETEVRYSGHLQITNPWLRLFTPIVAYLTGRVFTRELTCIKKAAEAGKV